jgi:hypothetical protein
MHGWMTNRHEGCVSTMLTQKRLEYCTGGTPLQGSARQNGGCKTESTALRGAFGLDNVREEPRFASNGDIKLHAVVWDIVQFWVGHGRCAARAMKNGVRIASQNGN